MYFPVGVAVTTKVTAKISKTEIAKMQFFHKALDVPIVFILCCSEVAQQGKTKGKTPKTSVILFSPPPKSAH